MPSSWLAGLQAVPCGQGVVLVNPFPPLQDASPTPPKIHDTAFGQCGVLSSKSACLQSSLESRLRGQLVESGSPLFRLTWKRWVINSQLRICALRARVPRTSDKDYSGAHFWPTVLAGDGKASGYNYNANGTVAIKLAGAAKLITHGQMYGEETVSSGPFVGALKHAPLNPEHCRWLMGYPKGWTRSEATVMPLCRKSQRNSSEPSWALVAIKSRLRTLLGYADD